MSLADYSPKGHTELDTTEIQHLSNILKGIKYSDFAVAAPIFV